jgi:hypothetical protein
MSAELSAERILAITAIRIAAMLNAFSQFIILSREANVQIRCAMLCANKTIGSSVLVAVARRMRAKANSQ